MKINDSNTVIENKFHLWLVACWIFLQEPMWWRDQAGWWFLPSASTLKLASSLLCWAPARTTKRRRSRKVRHETNLVLQVWKNSTHMELSYKESNCVKCWEKVWLECWLSPCQLVHISTLLSEQCRLEIIARFYHGQIWGFSCHTRWLCQQVEFMQSGLITTELFEGSNCSILTLFSFNLNTNALSVNEWDQDELTFSDYFTLCCHCVFFFF